MTKLAYIEDRYAAARTIVERSDAIEVFAVADPNGALLDRTVRELGREVRDGDVAQLVELLAVARRLRWRISVEPFPPRFAADRTELVEALVRRADRCKPLVGGETRWILDDLIRSANEMRSNATPPQGEFLVQSLADTAGTRIIIASGQRATAGFRSWMADLGVAVPVASDRERALLEVFDRAFLIGAPALFGPPAFAAPQARRLAYVVPSWVQDRSLPFSAISAHAEGGIRPRVRLRRVGQEAFIPERLREVENQLIPEVVWRAAKPQMPAGEDEVHARRILLCGGLSIMLDLEGEQIRVLDPERPAGDRITMEEVSTVGPGTYLVLREGQTESGALYALTLARLGNGAEPVEKAQAKWKHALRQRLQEQGPAEVMRRLRDQGVRAASQAPAWTADTLARPRRDEDFAILLRWLGLPYEPHLHHANALRLARAQATNEVREALEASLGRADLDELKRAGVLRMDLAIEGFASIIATRILAISPYLDVVTRALLRIPKEDASARWLE